MQKIMSQLTVLTKSVTDLHSIISEQNEKIDECTRKIDDLQKDNRKVSEFETKFQTINADLYHEYKMRAEREKNVILQGIPECSNYEEIVTEIINTVTAPKVIGIMKKMRLGKLRDNKPRLIKIVFKSHEDALLVLRNKSKLPVNQYPQIKMKNDLTPLQMQENAAIFKEFTSRKAAGESISIKYIYNQPRIVPVSEQRQNTSDRPKRERDRGSNSSPEQNIPKHSKLNSTHQKNY